MPVELEFYEIVDGQRNRYLQYHCEACQDDHLVAVDTKTMQFIRKAVATADEVLLWCGRGVKPETTLDFGLSQTIVPKRHLSRKKEKELTNIVSVFNGRVGHIKSEIHAEVEKLKRDAIEKIGNIKIGVYGDDGEES